MAVDGTHGRLSRGKQEERLRPKGGTPPVLAPKRGTPPVLAPKRGTPPVLGQKEVHLENVWAILQ